MTRGRITEQEWSPQFHLEWAVQHFHDVSFSELSGELYDSPATAERRLYYLAVARTEAALAMALKACGKPKGR